MSKEKVIVEGIQFDSVTPDKVVRLILSLMNSRKRIRLDYGDAETGKSWGEVYDIEGRIGRSTGSIKIPLLVHNSRSIGGGSVLTGCIVKIEYANKKEGGVLYEHPTYKKAIV